MNVLHISDLHFGPRHWEGDDAELLDKINSYNADIVINTGDSTSDGLESEFQEAGQFLKGITCENVISIIGNHDKRNMRSHEYFRQYIYNNEIIEPSRPELTIKKNLFLKRDITKIKNNFTDLNYVKLLTIDDVTVLIICIDSNQLSMDEGFVEEEVLRKISKKIDRMKYDTSMVLIHHSILATDEGPLLNSMLLTDFVRVNKVGHVFCGHTHQLDLRKSTDLYFDYSFTQYMSGSLSSCNHRDDDNMFLFYENWDTPEMRIYLIRVFFDGNSVSFNEELVLGNPDTKIQIG
ncbi:MAG: metallophosphoesterase [Desulfobacteraceae bacterium]|nr:metallophosphoesterase [Desulfobacteraceae bacterium]